MKSKKIFFILILLLVLCVISYIVYNVTSNNNKVAKETIINQEILKDNFKIEKLSLEKCKTVINNNDLNGIRFFLSYIYTKPKLMKDKIINIKVDVIFPDNLFHLLGTNMTRFNILCNSTHSDRSITSNSEMYGMIKEEDIDKFINQSNEFRLMIYYEDILLNDIMIKNTVN